ncbi:TetR family transcriptional regulator [Niveispirillum sp. SYP-B3756]|uniref:TetR/AcrR family transcriptional regulator n=1 Tax=Niveispirillum sp. SYP-B3756 TaxID=2662178 RepID=UPI001291F222|nr:TetR/AcrR family transcriptional regulator [Niveispirillum sp. SYP-B3756]MQP64970.1 TetR family transcriptional regulator [Niveispirillum sp. SYP-B3756]
MDSYSTFQQEFDLSMAALCGRILERHQATIRVRKADTAVPNLVRIIETTLALSNRNGFHPMSLRDLSEQSGLSMGALYSYFDSKDTLLLMILGQVVDAIGLVLTAPDVATGDPLARLRALMARHVYLTETMGPWFVFAFMEAKAFGKQGREMAVESELWTEGLLRDVIADGIDAGRFRPVDPTMVAALIKPMLQDWYVKRAKYRKRGVGPDAFVAVLVDLVGNMLRA